MSIDTLSQEVTQTQIPGDHEKLAHYYDTRKYDSLEASLTNTPITTCCGLVMVPQRDPKKFPVCPECQDIVDFRSRD